MDGGSGDTGTTTLCGNGDLDPGEDCDDGNVVGGDGCEASCTSSDDVPPVWTLELGGVGPNYGYPDCGTGVAFDGDGNLILGAYTAPDVIWLRKYDAQYVEQWTVTYDTFGGSCFVRVATDAMGNVGFVGTVAELPSGSSLDMFFGVLDPDGNEVWTTQLAGSGIEASDAGDVAFDAEGNLLVTGTVVFSPAIYGDVWVGKYDPLGAPLWSASYDGAVAGGDRGRGVAADVDGSVLVAGNTRGAGNTQDIFAAKYDSSGAEMWTDIVAGAAGSADFGWGVAAYGEDGFFTGIVRDLPMDGNTWLRRYDMSGQPTWTELYSGTGAGNDGAVDIALPDDGTGTVLLAGAVNDIAGDRYWVARLSTDGSVIWERRRIEDGGWYAVASAPDGRVAVAGYSFYPFPLDIEARFAVYPP